MNVTRTINYWAYYYRPNPTGFNLVAPRAGKFNGEYFYRAGRSIFDIHKLRRDVGPVAPTANFSSSPDRDLSGHAGDVHRHLDGLADELAVDLQGRHARRAPPLQSPAVTFATAGSKSVSLTASNSQGPSTVTKNIVVLTPRRRSGGSP